MVQLPVADIPPDGRLPRGSELLVPLGLELCLLLQCRHDDVAGRNFARAVVGKSSNPHQPLFDPQAGGLLLAGHLELGPEDFGLCGPRYHAHRLVFRLGLNVREQVALAQVQDLLAFVLRESRQ